MKLQFLSIFLVLFAFQSCQNKSEKQLLDTQKNLKKNELILKNIRKNWLFTTALSHPASQKYAAQWSEWRLFLEELNQKPKPSLNALKTKASEISKKVMLLQDNIPPEIDKPQIKARISGLMTRVRLFDMFIQLKNIPEQKVLILMTQINDELFSVQNQMDKIIQKSKIPLEEGESELRMMLDSSRAIPNEPIDPNLPRVE